MTHSTGCAVLEACYESNRDAAARVRTIMAGPRPAEGDKLAASVPANGATAHSIDDQISTMVPPADRGWTGLAPRAGGGDTRRRDRKPASGLWRVRQPGHERSLVSETASELSKLRRIAVTGPLRRWWQTRMRSQ